MSYNVVIVLGFPLVLGNILFFHVKKEDNNIGLCVQFSFPSLLLMRFPGHQSQTSSFVSLRAICCLVFLTFT